MDWKNYLIEKNFSSEAVRFVLEDEGSMADSNSNTWERETMFNISNRWKGGTMFNISNRWKGGSMFSSYEPFYASVFRFCKKNGYEYGEKLETGDLLKKSGVYYSVIYNDGYLVKYIKLNNFSINESYKTEDGKWKLNVIDKAEKIIPSWHSEEEPVIKYKSGLEVYAFMEMFMSKEMWKSIIDKTISAKEAMEISNMEVRQKVMERLGWEKVFNDLDAQKISEDKYGELWDIDLRDDWMGRKARFLKFIDPSENNKEGFLRVHPNCKTPEEAVAWSYSLIEEGIDYNPNLRI
jgi:hypothetical protein